MAKLYLALLAYGAQVFHAHSVQTNGSYSLLDTYEGLCPPDAS